DPARHLVAVDPAVVRQAQRRVAPPEVQVGAADVGDADADQDRIGLDLGQRKLADLERPAGSMQDRGRTGRGHVSDLRMITHAAPKDPSASLARSTENEVWRSKP